MHWQLFLWIAVFIRRAAAKRRYKKERNERKARRKEQEKQWELAQTQQDILLKQVDELLEKKRTQNTRGPKVHDEEPEDFDYDEGYTDDEDDYGDYDEEQEAELDRWLAGLDDGQDEDGPAITESSVSVEGRDGDDHPHTNGHGF